MLRDIFQAESSLRNLTEGGGNFQRELNCPEGIFWGLVDFTREGLSTEHFPKRREFFIDFEPDFQ